MALESVLLMGNQKSRADRWLNDRLKRARREQFAEFGKLDPALAAKLLDLNIDNRTMRENTVVRYARDIESDRWAINGEPIIVSADGTLNDGQHRCGAVLKSGKPIYVLFVFGVSVESRLTTDQGVQKGAGDYLGMEGIKNPNNLAAIGSAILQFKRSRRFSSASSWLPTKQEVREAVLKDRNIDYSFQTVRKKGASRLASYTVLGLAHYLFAEVDPNAADEFMDKLITGLELRSRDPIYVVREKLLTPNMRLTKNEQLKALIMAWNNWRARKTVRTLTHIVRKGEKMPEIR